MSHITKKTLENKVCIITGGAGLLGGAFSFACAEVGAIVIIVDINQKAGELLAVNIREKTKNRNVFFKKADITDENEVRGLIASVAGEFKGIDCLVNNAYPRNKNYGALFEKVTYKDFSDNISRHLGGYFLVTREVATVMKRQQYGSIVNMGSIYGFAAPRFEIYSNTTMTTPIEYSAIKGGILNMTTYLASYLGAYNIRVNALSPGGIANNQPKNFVRQYTKKVLLGVEKRMAVTSDIMGALIFLLSDSSSYITGQNIVVDGGWSL